MCASHDILKLEMPNGECDLYMYQGQFNYADHSYKYELGNMRLLAL